MKPTHNSLLRLAIYLSVLLISIAGFYGLDGSFETDIISFPTLWTDWFYFLYIVVPLFILVRLIYRIVIKKEPYTQSLNSIVFLVGLIIVHVLYWFVVDTYKSLLFQEVQAVEAKISSEINDVNLTNVNSKFELNRFNKNRSYKISFTTLRKPTYETHINVQGFNVDENKRVLSSSLTLSTAKEKQEHYLYIGEKYLRTEATSKDMLDFKISYTTDFPRARYKSRAKIAQQLCTWSIIGCRNTGKEVSWHDTELFESTIFQLPYKINSSESPLLKIKLSNFTSLDKLLPFTNILFLTEETTRKHGVIEKFILKFKVDSRITGYIYSQIFSAEHSGKLLTIPLEDKSVISKGDNIISFSIDVNELSTLMNTQKESDAIEFKLFISNNRGWYCPNFVCEIINNPNQLKHFVVKTKNIYRAEDFPVAKPK